ncbi:hypothetical protein [Microscilla marina]|nr:hypothetical protein [Microscilla marina]
MNPSKPTNIPVLIIDQNQHKICLQQKSTRVEVRMSPLCKALYFLFLKHPQGITLYDLHTYEKDLMLIYKRISRRNDFEAMKKSIHNLVDRSENSFHEKCARIKATFKKVVPLELVDLYYIKGERGGEKKIHLPNTQIIYTQCT